MVGMDTNTQSLFVTKPALSADDWQLYTATNPPSVMKRVASSLNSAAYRSLKAAHTKLARMKLGTPKAAIQEALHNAYAAHLEKTLEKYASYGAFDTEPRYVARTLMQNLAAQYGVAFDS